MSRKGKTPIDIPSGVQVTIAGSNIQLKGPKGTLQQSIENGVNVAQNENQLLLTMNEDHESTQFLGLYHTLITNMITGVTKGFEKSLEMIGVGYRAIVKGTELDLQVGLSHPSAKKIPDGIQVKVDKNTQILITGADKQQVGQFAAEIRAVRPPEPFQGKGIRYKGEHVRRKAGKTAAKK